MKAFWKLLSRIKKYKLQFVLSIVCNVLLSIFTVISIPVIIPFFQILFDRVPDVMSIQSAPDGLTSYFKNLIYSQGKDQALLIVCGMIVLVFLLKNLFRFLSLYFLVPLRTGIVRDIRKELFDKYMALPMAYYSEHRIGDLISRITLDVQEVEVSIINMIQVIFKAPLIIIGSIGYMVYVSPKLTLFVIALLLFTIFVIGGISKTLKQRSNLAQQKLGNITTTVEESISGIRIIKAFNAETDQAKRFGRENEGYKKTISAIMHRQNLSSPLSEFLGISVVTALLWYGSKLVFSNDLLPETFFAFIFAFYQVIEPAKSFSRAYYNIQKGMAAVDRIENLMIQETKQMLKPIDSTPIDFKNHIKIKNLSYQYTNDEKQVLKDVSFTINKGELVALVGPSGAGKTTITDLIMGFYDVQDGAINIDDLVINNIEAHSLRSLFGLVSQHPILFNDTIENNIKFGINNTNIHDIINAAKIANAHDFIMQLKDGYQTIIGDKGMKLSGGQRQRLTIARAVLYNPQILILDEATSALDSESEKLVQDALTKILLNRTSIVIAHRLSTIKNADKIIVMDDGKVLAIGKHEELYHISPLYQKYVDMQGVIS
ncbi:MAG: ABC transporter ATP-binding protein [Saprospiraceae bacterium]